MAKTNMGLISWLLALFTGFIGPLILYLIDKDKKGKDFENVKSSLNFQINIAIIGLVLGITIVGMVLFPVLWLVHIIFCIIGIVTASKDEVYHTPVTFLKLIK